MKKVNQKIETRLPVFTGFYNTVFNSDDKISNEIENINQIRLKNNLNEIDTDTLFGLIEVDNTAYENDVAADCCELLENKLTELNLVSSIKFNCVISPQYYNYSNDKIDCVIELTQDNISNIKTYLDKNINSFEQYLHSNYSHRDGFSSNYPNNVTDWIELTKNFTDYSDYNTLYSVLDFVCDNESIDTEYLYCEIEVCINVLNSDVLTTLEYDYHLDKFIKLTSNCGKPLIQLYNEFYEKQLVIFDKPDFETWFKSNQNLFTFEYVDKFGNSEND